MLLSPSNICSDGNVRYYEYEGDAVYPLSEYKSSEPQRGMCFLPRRALNVSECEIARAYKLASLGTIEPVAFVVPRKADSFQADIYPPAPSLEPSLNAGEFFTTRGDITRRIVDLSSGATSALSGPLTLVPPSISYSSSQPPSSISPATPAAATPKVPPTLASSTVSSVFTASVQPPSAGLGQTTFSSSFKPAVAQEYSADNDVSMNLPVYVHILTSPARCPRR